MKLNCIYDNDSTEFMRRKREKVFNDSINNLINLYFHKSIPKYVPNVVQANRLFVEG